MNRTELAPYKIKIEGQATTKVWSRDQMFNIIRMAERNHMRWSVERLEGDKYQVLAQG